jgi:hypothetical protein
MYFILIWGIPGCNQERTGNNSLLRVNTNHLDRLYEEIVAVNGDSVGIIHLYSEYPDYDWVGDDDEGIACVDDAARAAIFYLRRYNYTTDTQALRKGRMLIRFLLSMQAENGYMYNFIWPDHTINKEGKTSLPQPDWWSWRAMWAFAEANLLLENDDPLLGKIQSAQDTLIQLMLRDLPRETHRDTFQGIIIPAWLPAGSAADQASVILTGLTLFPSELIDSRVKNFMAHVADGMLELQVENQGEFPDGAFLSWRNVWHAYGNSQAYALLKTYEVVGDTAMKVQAVREINNFYPQLWNRGVLSAFQIQRSGGNVVILEEEAFPQIAYGIRPMVWACLEAWKLTGNQQYLHQARTYGSWFSGKNQAQLQMYDPETGRGFDGLNNANEINKNAGAESTIEALLALQELKFAEIQD